MSKCAGTTLVQHGRGIGQQSFEQTVNLPAHAFGGSNPPRPTPAVTSEHMLATLWTTAAIAFVKRMTWPASVIGDRQGGP